MYQEPTRRLSDLSERCHVRKFACLLARPLSHSSTTSDGGQGGQTEATTVTTAEAGTSSPSTATAPRSVGVEGIPPKDAGCGTTWPTIRRGAPSPTSTTPSSPPEAVPRRLG